MGMLQVAQDARFAQEAVELAPAGGDRGQDGFDRGQGVVRLAQRQVDDAHAAAAQLGTSW